jgi:hypothetical protein
MTFQSFLALLYNAVGAVMAEIPRRTEFKIPNQPGPEKFETVTTLDSIYKE